MKVISWNVRGFGGRDKWRLVKKVISQENLDIVVLLETKHQKYSHEFVMSIWSKR